MDINNKIEMARNALNIAVHMNMNREIILKISRIIDEYIVEYYQESQNVGLDKRENTKTCSCNSCCVTLGNK